MLMNVTHHLLFTMLIVNGCCTAVVVLKAINHHHEIIWDWLSESGGWASFRRKHVFSPFLPKQFHVRRRQLFTYIGTVCVMLPIQAALMFCYDLTARGAAAC